MTVTKADLGDLFDGKLPWDRTKAIVSGPKDDGRFQVALEVLQERVSWPERILLPLSEHLYVVEKTGERAGERIVKCDCGYEFGDWRRNWKLSAAVIVRDDAESLEEIYPGLRRPDPELCEVREFICPGCGVLLKVETVPVGYPIIFDVLPDLDAFYQDWLRAPLSDTQACEDRTFEIIEEWAQGGPTPHGRPA